MGVEELRFVRCYPLGTGRTELRKTQRLSMDAIHKILVPTDFSAHADEAFRVAHTLAANTPAHCVNLACYRASSQETTRCGHGCAPCPTILLGVVLLHDGRRPLIGIAADHQDLRTERDCAMTVSCSGY